MALISIQDVSIGFRGPPLLDSVSCQIERGQRIGLLGRNGAGKTTFLRILCGEEQPDSGELQVAPGVSVSLLRQDVPRGSAVESAMLLPKAGMPERTPRPTNTNRIGVLDSRSSRFSREWIWTLKRSSSCFRPV